MTSRSSASCIYVILKKEERKKICNAGGHVVFSGRLCVCVFVLLNDLNPLWKYFQLDFANESFQWKMPPHLFVFAAFHLKIFWIYWNFEWLIRKKINLGFRKWCYKKLSDQYWMICETDVFYWTFSGSNNYQQSHNQIHLIKTHFF